MSDSIEQFARSLRANAEVAPPPALWLRTEAAYLEGFTPRRRSRRAAWMACAASVLVAGLYLIFQPESRAPDPRVQYIEAIDRQLQRAYSDGSSDAELDALWREREQRLEQLKNENPPQPIRI